MSAHELFIQGATLIDGTSSSVHVRDGRVHAVGSSVQAPKNIRVIDASKSLLLPGLINSHTHASMTIFRGYSDDLVLKDWLEKRIWPAEAKLTEEDCYWGARLACAEMIRTGTTFFADMYWHLPGVARAVRDSGIRAIVTAPIIKYLEPNTLRPLVLEFIQRGQSGEWGPRVQVGLGPHAPYSCTQDDLEWCAKTAKDHDLVVLTHLLENQSERELKPVELFKKTGMLDTRLIAAHGVWLDERDVETLAAAGRVSIAHCPVSNMKLACGAPEMRAFPYRLARKHGLNVVLGTDGAASNNNLDLFEEMKIAALLAKHFSQDPVTLPAHEALDLVTTSGARALGIPQREARIAVGQPADFALLDLEEICFTPRTQLISHVVYAAHGSAVHTTICDGQILMENRTIPGLDEVRAKVAETSRRIC